VLLVTAVILAFLWAATEWTAWRLAFQPQLGPPWFDILGWEIQFGGDQASLTASDRDFTDLTIWSTGVLANPTRRPGFGHFPT
jgi:hypothetical protein